MEVVALKREPEVSPVVDVSCKITPVVIAPAVKIAKPDITTNHRTEDGVKGKVSE